MPRRAAADITRTTKRLTKEGIVGEAITLADAGGLDGLSMRKLAQHLGVDAMSIYYHVRDKDTLLAEMADAVVAGIGPTAVHGGNWTDQLRELIMAARATGQSSRRVRGCSLRRPIRVPLHPARVARRRLCETIRSTPRGLRL